MKLPDIHKRISHKNEFELCFLRHQYLRRIKHNATREEMEPYLKIVDNFGKNTYYTYKNLFLLVGMDFEDVLNITQVYLATYIGLFALERNPDKLREFKAAFKNRNSIRCSKENILDKNKANFTCFLKQRLQDLVRVCRQKAKNIKGIVAEEFLVFTGTKAPPVDIEELLESHDRYGYRPLDTNVFKTIKKKIMGQEGPVYTFNKNWYVCVPIRKKALTLTDFVCNNYDPRENLCNMTPEEYLDVKDEAVRSREFQESSAEDKAEVIRTFLVKNEENPEFEEEVRIAQKFLKNLGV